MCPWLESNLHDPRCTMRRQNVSTLRRSRFKIISEYEAYKCQVKTVTSHLLLVFAIISINVFSKYISGTYSRSNVFISTLVMYCKGRHGPYPLGAYIHSSVGKSQDRSSNRCSMYSEVGEHRILGIHNWWR